MRTIGGGTVAGDQAAYTDGHPAPTRAVQPFASWLVSYQRYVYLPGTLLGVILLGGLAAMIARGRIVRRTEGRIPGRLGGRAPGAAALAGSVAVTILLVPPAIADFDLRYLVPAVPAACLAAALACAPSSGSAHQRRCTTSPAATRSTVSGDTRTSSLPSGSTPTASPETS